MSATDEDLRQANDKLELWKATAKGLADRVVRMEYELTDALNQRAALANHIYALAHLLAAANQQFLHSAAVTQDIKAALAEAKGGTQ
jgi:chromosome segregation ATPase